MMTKTVASTSNLALNRLKLNFGGYMTFESTFKVLKPDNYAFYLLQIASFDRLITQFCILFCLRFASKMRKISGDWIRSCVRNNSIPLWQKCDIKKTWNPFWIQCNCMVNKLMDPFSERTMTTMQNHFCSIMVRML